MGLFLDSFDNDGQKNNPFVSVMLNDATRQYDHQSDGSQQILSGFFRLEIFYKIFSFFFFISFADLVVRLLWLLKK